MSALTTMLFTFAFLGPLLAHSLSPHDKYYSDNMDTAIEEARYRTHHYDYSRSQRYHRSTSQSIQLRRMLNTEMADATIKAPAEVNLQPEEEQQEKKDARFANRADRFDNAQQPERYVPDVKVPARVSIKARFSE